MNGKNKCKILKEIRRQIAEQNDIEYVTSECQHKGDCKGTCPKCEAEVRYLEKELEKRQRLGRTVAVVGIAAALAVSTVGCDDMPKEPIVDELQGNYDDMPTLNSLNFEELLLLKKEDRNEYISGYSRKQINDAWGECLKSAFYTEDYFIIYQGEDKYSVIVTYNDDEDKDAQMPKSVEVYLQEDIPDTSGDPGPEY